MALTKSVMKSGFSKPSGLYYKHEDFTISCSNEVCGGIHTSGVQELSVTESVIRSVFIFYRSGSNEVCDRACF